MAGIKIYPSKVREKTFAPSGYDSELDISPKRGGEKGGKQPNNQKF